MEPYLTLSVQGTDEFTEKKSRFLGCAAPVCSKQEALGFFAAQKKKYWDAKHNVPAFVLRSGEQHCSDAGEPQGTAGVPVLNVLLKSGVTDAAVVVTRYFGGVLLGTGGLVRAYSHAASLALSAAGLLQMKPCLLLKLFCTYSQYGKVAALLPAHGAVIDSTGFTDQVQVSFHLEAAALPALTAELADATGGSVLPQTLGETYFPVQIHTKLKD
ncbi:MAG: YigZ family protein [Oscillospiraceae bacterium]|nr:YigZ family protein [Oscillospiraceae bacterium]MDD3260854.1 YigZ family protein [Oscillospiraceae bacterium]